MKERWRQEENEKKPARDFRWIQTVQSSEGPSVYFSLKDELGSFTAASLTVSAPWISPPEVLCTVGQAMIETHRRFINCGPDLKKTTLCVIIFSYAFMCYLFMVNSFYAAPSSLFQTVAVGGARASVIMVPYSSSVNSLVAVFKCVFTDGM